MHLPNPSDLPTGWGQRCDRCRATLPAGMRATCPNCGQPITRRWT